MHIRKSSTVDAQILHVLMNGEMHTRKAIAARIEVSIRTVSRGVERLRIVFIIHADHRGIYLDPQHVYYELKRKRA